MAHIHWYPGHIAKAERKLKEQLSIIDVVIEVRDARIPLSSEYPDIENLIKKTPRLILLNKADLVDKNLLDKWITFIKKSKGVFVLPSCTNDNKINNQIISCALKLGEDKINKLKAKGLLERPIRAMVVGLPNVGKSSVINRLIKRAKTKTGEKAGVTRQQQWVRIHPKVDLLDTPGIIPVKQPDQKVAAKLAFVNSVGENAFDNIEVANELLLFLKNIVPQALVEKYAILESQEINIYNIALNKKWLIKAGEPDEPRTAGYVLSDFREGRLGKIILDKLDE